MKYSGEITSLEDLNKISQAASINCIKIPNSFQYYRGHGCCTFKLLSYISRYFSKVESLQEVEQKIIYDLKQNTEDANKEEYFYIPQNSNGLDPDWYWLTQAQHLGIPTRLMDWTLSSEIALYFAVSDNSYKNKDGDLWVFFIPAEFNIYNKKQNVYDIKPFQTDNDLFINIPIQWSNNYETNEPQRNMLSQQGKFFMKTLENSLIPLEEQVFYQNHLLRYKITSNHKDHILKELTALNYSKETIFKTIDQEMKQIMENLISKYDLNVEECSS
jgi:hypothetical protein